MEIPNYYICTSDEAREKVKQYSTRGIVDLNTLKSDEFVNNWDKLKF
jgi:hypothetical protein